MMETIVWQGLFKCETCTREIILVLGGEPGSVVPDSARQAFIDALKSAHEREDCSGKRETEPWRPQR